MALLSSKLPEEEVNQAVSETLMEAACGPEEGIDFEDFVSLLREDSNASLSSSVDLYDARQVGQE